MENQKEVSDSESTQDISENNAKNDENIGKKPSRAGSLSLKRGESAGFSDVQTQEMNESELDDLQMAPKKQFSIKLVQNIRSYFGNTKITLQGGKEVELGRSPVTGIKDPRLSSLQLTIIQHSVEDDYCAVKIKGKNPSAVLRKGSSDLTLLPGKSSEKEEEKVHFIYDGDVLFLLVNLFPFQISVKPKKDARQGKNFQFYNGDIQSEPHGDFIGNVHKKWFGSYDLLESHHGYIQWLFPLFEGGGMNYQSKALKKEEARLMREDLSIAKRIIKSYQLMLDFYGIRLADLSTGRLERNVNWKDRFRNLNSNTHNNLRINRIITSLGHLGFQKWKKPLVSFFENEIVKNNLLPNCKRSLKDFWVEALDVDSDKFKNKTGEMAEDRTDSVFFAHLEQNPSLNLQD
eukprot:TRINITY_DN3665_c0_g1_i1.p1 TRINITY_DN3665_c0_g1~~TRINITY_DN3665_c0_g1_i1.p1  ORF type:complete len:440 (-),score=190.13 TRINITY_DN3665_c0_g1_i1:42-1250(-)